MMAKANYEYDVICVGGVLSSYLCAALLAKSGHKVLLIQESDYAEGSREGFDSGLAFDPDFLPLAGPAQNVIRQMFRKLDLDFDGLEPLSSVTQILNPRYRLKLTSNPEESIKEIRREIDFESDSVVDLFEQFYSVSKASPEVLNNVQTLNQSTSEQLRTWRKAWTSDSFYRSIHKTKPARVNDIVSGDQSAEVEGLLNALLAGLSYVTPSNIGFEQVSRSIPLYLQGQAMCPRNLKQKLSAIIKANGGTVRDETQIDALAVENGKIVGVLLSSYEGVCLARQVALFNRVRRIYHSLPENMRDSTLLRSLERLVPSHWRYTLAVELDREVLPLGVTPHMVYVGSSRYPLQEDNFLRLQVSPDNRLLLVTTLVPYKASALNYGYLRRLSGTIMQVLSSVIPFLDSHMIRLHPDFRKGESEIAKCYPFSGPDWVPENLIQYYVRGHKSVQDFWGLSMSTVHQNLHIGGRMVWPSLGLYGEFLSAQKIAKEISTL
ncbi:MAG: hypothetical protein AB7F43_08500 [Bacteriovoracia bacterium]